MALASVQQRKDHWVIADPLGNAAYVRRVPVSGWVKVSLDAWTTAANPDTWTSVPRHQQGAASGVAWTIAHGMLGAMEAERQPMRRVSGALPPAAMAALQESGFVVLAGPYPVERLGVIADAYDAEVGAAVEDDIRIGSTSTRVVDFVNRGPLFDPLYVDPPLLDAAARIH